MVITTYSVVHDPIATIVRCSTVHWRRAVEVLPLRLAEVHVVPAVVRPAPLVLDHRRRQRRRRVGDGRRQREGGGRGGRETRGRDAVELAARRLVEGAAVKVTLSVPAAGAPVPGVVVVVVHHRRRRRGQRG